MGDAQDSLITDLIARVKVLRVENEKLRYACKRYLRQVELGGPEVKKIVKDSITYNMIKEAVQ